MWPDDSSSFSGCFTFFFHKHVHARIKPLILSWFLPLRGLELTQGGRQGAEKTHSMRGLQPGPATARLVEKVSSWLTDKHAPYLSKAGGCIAKECP